MAMLLVLIWDGGDDDYVVDVDEEFVLLTLILLLSLFALFVGLFAGAVHTVELSACDIRVLGDWC